MSARTGAGALVNPDNIAVYRIVIVVLAAAAIGSLVASVDGLLHVASWYMAPRLAWTLPLALDGFMIGTAIATLALRQKLAERSKELSALRRQLRTLTAPPAPAPSGSPWRPDARPAPAAPLALVEQRAAEVMAR